MHFSSVTDEFLGLNWKEQNISAALKHAAANADKCADCLWLSQLFPSGGKAPSPAEARAVFLAAKKDARALFFAALVDRPIDQDLVLKAAEMDLAAAQGWMAEKFGGEERKEWAEKAAKKEDPRGLCVLGLCADDDGDSEKAADLYKRSAERGWVDAM